MEYTKVMPNWCEASRIEDPFTLSLGVVMGGEFQQPERNKGTFR